MRVEVDKQLGLGTCAYGLPGTFLFAVDRFLLSAEEAQVNSL